MSLWLPNESQLVQNPELLRETLGRYERLLKGDGYAFWEWGLHNGTYRCGGSFWEKLGYEAVDDAVTSVDNVQEYVHPDDFGYVYNVVLDHLRHNTPINAVYRIRAADGTYWWTQASATSTRDESGRVTYLTGVNFDLSHLKSTEKALRMSEARHARILADSNDGLWEWSATDANSNPKRAGRKGILHTSYSFWRDLGYSEEEVDSLPLDERIPIWRSHIHPHDLPRMRRALRQHFVAKGPIDFEFRVFGEKGKMFWMRARGSSIFNTHGRMILTSGININITELKESEERVRNAKEEAERANLSKTHFLQSMSHELRTPLNAILGFSRLLSMDTNLPDENRENAEYINHAGKHLLQLINGVLDLAQIEAGKLSLSFSNISPAQLVEESIAYCVNQAKSRGIQIHFRPGVYKDVMLRVDPMRLRQCLLNLLSNAVKYNHENGEVFVDFSIFAGDLEISVSDTGPGISKEQQSSLFQVFNRLGAQHTNIEGTGLGLALSRQLAAAMNGSLTYHHRDSAGACFKLYFPIVEVAHTQALVEEAGASTMKLEFDQTKQLYYIEDNRANIRLLEVWLESYKQLRLASSEDPLTGLYEIRQTLPDLILLDINLPKLSGFEVLRVLKDDPLTRHIPVVALTANAMATDVEQGLNKGFDAYLTKPLDIQKLASILNQLFGRELTS